MQRETGMFVNVNIQSFHLVGGPGDGLTIQVDNNFFDRYGQIVYYSQGGKIPAGKAMYQRRGPKSWQADGGQLHFIKNL